MIPHRSLSRYTSENGVSSRVEACRRRLRLIRGNHKESFEQVVSAGNTEVSKSQEVIEMKAQRMDEAGIR